MKTKMLTAVGAIACLAMMFTTAKADHIWINEFHYDNPDADFGEFVEVGFRTPNMSGFNPSDYAIELYNGNGGAMYGTAQNLSTFAMSGPIPIAGSASIITLFTFQYPVNGIQNGSPDGIALVNVTNNTVESFLSYEGVFTATGSGVAGTLGVTSTDVGVAEPGIGNLTSLSAAGTGIGANQFNASSFVLTEVQTPGAINTGQVFAVAVIPEPGSLALLGLGMLGLVSRRRK